MLVKGKAHNPYNTENAERLLSELTMSFKNRTYDKTKFDFKAATEEDEEVMRKILNFIEEKQNEKE